MTTPQPPLSLSCAETAKRLRTALKETFPTVKFSVRSDSYAGGASIDVRWTDGPTSKQVQAVCNRFEGATLDGMTDSQSYKTHLVDGQSIQYGADFVHAKRRLSVAFLTKVAQTYCRRHRCTMPRILEQSTGAHIAQPALPAQEIMRQAWPTSEAELARKERRHSA